MAKTLERGCLVIDGFPPTPFDIRLLRAHLHLEETAELLDGLIHRDEVRVLDALADTSFITNGTALTFGLPLAEAYHEVCDSNMTKAVRDPGDTRLRNKGASYIPPDIAGVIEEHRIYRDGTEV
jgi:hypothetical protein